MVNKETYNRIFEDIAEAVKSVVLDKNDADILARIILHSKYAVLQTYSRLNIAVKAGSMAGGQERLDRHKCGACFMVAFEKRLIIIGEDEKYENHREKIAIIAGMTVLVSFAEIEAKIKGDHQFINYINSNRGFVIPKSTLEQKSCEELWAMELRRIYTRAQEAEAALSIANRLFLIEEFNRERAKNF